MKLRAYNGQGERIAHKLNHKPPYLVENGINFLELSLPLLKEVYGKKWRERTSLASHLYDTRRYYRKATAKDRIICIADIFPDKATRGLEGFRGAIVTKLNGTALIDLVDFRRRIQQLGRPKSQDR